MNTTDPVPAAASPLAPVVLFAYARLDHLRLTVESLLRNPECATTELHVYCDGPRQPQHQPRTDAVRAYVDSISGFASVRRVYRDSNRGLAASVISGVSELLAMHETVIVMEDDLVVSPHFLQYMNAGLQLYRDDERVASIHGYCYPVDGALPQTFFLRGADCWGWATWARAWRHFEPDGRKLLASLRQQRLTRDFDMGGASPYTRMLSNQVAGRNDSWAVRWHAACFLDNMLTLYPGRSLVNNIGMDASGTHCSTTEEYAQTVAGSPVLVERLALAEDPQARALVQRFLARQSSFLARAKRARQRLLDWLARK